MKKSGKAHPGEHVILEGDEYQVLHVCTGPGKARVIAQQGPDRYWRTVRGQWCVLQKCDRGTVTDLK